jgi:hypothetical protein
MVYERNQQMREKYLKQPPRWILGIIKKVDFLSYAAMKRWMTYTVSMIRL